MVVNIRKRYKPDEYEAYLMSNFKILTQGKLYSLEQLFTETYVVNKIHEHDLRQLLKRARKWLDYKNGDKPYFV
jgi:hypothetical protein